MATATIVVLTPAKNLNNVFWGFLVVSPLFISNGCLEKFQKMCLLGLAVAILFLFTFFNLILDAPRRWVRTGYDKPIFQILIRNLAPLVMDEERFWADKWVLQYLYQLPKVGLQIYFQKKLKLYLRFSTVIKEQIRTHKTVKV